MIKQEKVCKVSNIAVKKVNKLMIELSKEAISVQVLY